MQRTDSINLNNERPALGLKVKRSSTDDKSSL